MKRQKSYLMTRSNGESYDYPGQREEEQALHKIRMKRDQLRKKRKKKKR